ncbi:MAG: phasin family protein [Micavibrio aeruginosavorus]|nr:phasin family protein [Micavibrio aeruginosavorus]
MTTHKAEKAEKLAAEAAFVSKEQMDAFLQCGTLWMKGTEDIVKTCVSLTQDAVEKNTEAVKCLMGCKTLNELTETQTKLVQESFDDLMANATKLSEMSVRLATNSFEPINAQFSKTLKKAADRTAA